MADAPATGIYEGNTAASLGAADWLSLAAAPAFALMALLTAAHGGSADMHGSATHDAPPLSGMTLMYLLMSLFHLAPWLKIVSKPRAGFLAAKRALSLLRITRNWLFDTHGSNVGE